MRCQIALVTFLVGLAGSAALAQDDNSDIPGATGVYTDSDGNQTTVELPDVRDRTPQPMDEKTQDFMNGNFPSDNTGENGGE